MGYVIVNYPVRREVFVDTVLNNHTNEVIRVCDGTHKFDLGEPGDYEPEELEVTVTGTDVLNPLEITFVKKSGP